MGMRCSSVESKATQRVFRELRTSEGDRICRELNVRSERLEMNVEDVWQTRSLSALTALLCRHVVERDA